ncbi:MAG: glycosyltransferase family 4 protein [Verrucomicrobia bacterium]|nr:glycosyltransferase family 4 protein [Verrucomicrobiota bacterium]
MKSITILKSRFNSQGGAEKYARCLADALHKKGCQVTVLTTETTGTFPYEVINHKLRSLTSLGKVLEFDAFCQKYIKRHPTDIVFGHDRNTFQTHLRAGSGVHRSFLKHRKLSEPRWLCFRHKCNPLHATLLNIEKKGFEHPDLKVLFANSNLVKNEILTHYNIAPEKIEVIHNGVEWADWQQSFDAWPTQKREDRFEFLFLGSNFERKGLAPLLAALRKLRGDFHLSVVGKDKNQRKFEQLATGLPVSFYGPQQDVRPFLQIADSLVIPSFYDPFANVTTEALAMGLFVVSSKTNGGSEVLSSENGAIIEDDLTAALEIALTQPKTVESALKIRQSIKHLDFATNLNTYIEKCLSPTS